MSRPPKHANMPAEQGFVQTENFEMPSANMQTLLPRALAYIAIALIDAKCPQRPDIEDVVTCE